MQKKRTSNIVKYLGLFIFICGAFMLVYHQSMNLRLNNDNNLKIEEFFNEEKKEQVVPEKEQIKETNTSNVSYNYVAVLEIPNINLKRGLVDKNSKYNNVNYNIKIINESTMPDVVNGNLILAGHNGAGYIAFFKNLDRLKVNDKINVYYNGYKYIYSLNKSYETSKNGNIKIYRDSDKTTITLITCKKNSNDTQVVYVGYLESKEIY